MIDVKKKTRFPRHSQYKEYIKCFSVDKLGIDEAWKQAKKFREECIVEVMKTLETIGIEPKIEDGQLVFKRW